ncbi:hypothetical protein ROLI_013170 [Roseobacter fucihabitans]|uniref:Uncharacterized protein n=1 Tax=Roseobacter fucihabitans TaxID=1537242 RepID=A0ABZ2BRB1_9RHOB|nr:hypothetical protein [Roseobacter litoralis]
MPVTQPISAAPATRQAAHPKLHLNWEDWLPMMEDEDIPEDQKRAFIEALWSITVAFVDVGWGLSTEAEICGQDLDLTAALRSAVLNSQSQPEKEDL